MYTMFILFSLTSCHCFEAEDNHIYDRTVLVYMAADNNLSSFQKDDLNEMLRGAIDIPSNSRLIIYVDDTSLPRILTFERQKGRRPVCKTLHRYDIEHNSGDAETLRMAMEWVIDNSPSESYGLVLWSHGESWIPFKSPAQKAVCLDSNSGSWMEIPDIANVLSSFPRLEFILFDACFMQSIEVAYELRNNTNYIIGSPAEIPAPGAPYNRIIKPMFSLTNCAEGITEEYYKAYNEGGITINGSSANSYGVCLSIIDCSQMDQLAKVTKDMITKYAASTQSPETLQEIQRYYYKESSTRPRYYDMNGYMLRLLTDHNDYIQWKDAFNRAVCYKITTPQWYSGYTGMEKIDMKNYGGVSCYIPQNTSNRTNLNKAFTSTLWYHAAGWQQIGW